MGLAPWTCVCGQRNVGLGPCPRCLTPAPDWAGEASIVPLGRHRHPWVVPLAVVTVVLLVAGGIGAVVVRNSPTSERAHDLVGTQKITVSPDSSPVDLPGTAGEIAAALPALMRFVQDARGLAFKEPVEVELLTDDAFRARLAEIIDEDKPSREEFENDERVLKALGLVEGDIDLEEALNALYSDAVAGFYQPEDDALVVRGDRFSPYVKVTFVHELTHALQDQHFDLHRPEMYDREDESGLAFDALVEGDAKRIEALYVETLTDEEQKAAQDEEREAASGVDPTTPRILLELLVFPYVVGPRFTGEIFRAQGQSRLDAVFAEPPSTTEQVLHPDADLADGERPRAVAKPKADDDIIDEGVFGELLLVLLFSRFLDSDDAIAAAQGWGGDSYVAWRDGDGACVRVNVVMDTAADARALRDALRDVARARDGVDVDVTPQLLRFTACA